MFLPTFFQRQLVGSLGKLKIGPNSLKINSKKFFCWSKNWKNKIFPWFDFHCSKAFFFFQKTQQNSIKDFWRIASKLFDSNPNASRRRSRWLSMIYKGKKYNRLYSCDQYLRNERSMVVIYDYRVVPDQNYAG